MSVGKNLCVFLIINASVTITCKYLKVAKVLSHFPHHSTTSIKRLKQFSQIQFFSSPFRVCSVLKDNNNYKFPLKKVFFPVSEIVEREKTHRSKIRRSIFDSVSIRGQPSWLYVSLPYEEIKIIFLTIKTWRKPRE